jgi:hypothetical protein
LEGFTVTFKFRPVVCGVRMPVRKVCGHKNVPRISYDMKTSMRWKGLDLLYVSIGICKTFHIVNCSPFSEASVTLILLWTMGRPVPDSEMKTHFTENSVGPTCCALVMAIIRK